MAVESGRLVAEVAAANTYISKPYQSSLGQAILQAMVGQILYQQRKNLLELVAIGRHVVQLLAHFDFVGVACLIEGHYDGSFAIDGVEEK